MPGVTLVSELCSSSRGSVSDKIRRLIEYSEQGAESISTLVQVIAHTEYCLVTEMSDLCV